MAAIEIKLYTQVVAFVVQTENCFRGGFTFVAAKCRLNLQFCNITFCDSKTARQSLEG